MYLAAGAITLAGAVAAAAWMTMDGDSVPTAAGDEPIVLLAVSERTTHSAAYAYIGDGNEQPVPQAGTYTIFVSNSADRVLVLDGIEADGVSPLEIPDALWDGGSKVDAELAASIRTVVDGFVLVKLTELTAFEASSSGFDRRLFSGDEGDVWSTLDELYGAYSELGAQQGAVLAAMDLLDLHRRTTGRAAVGGQFARPTAGVWESIKGSFLGFFGYAGDAGERAASSILTAAETMNAEDRELAFASLPASSRGGATDFEDLERKLRSGELDNQAAQLRRELWSDPGFAAAAQDACKCNRPDLDTAHREGTELVTRGAELNVAIIETVLGDVFPDITSGFKHAREYIEKVNEWADYGKELYLDPLGTIEGSVREGLQDQIAGRIKADLAECCGDLDPELVADAAETIAGQLVAQVPPVFGDDTSGAGQDDPGTVADAEEPTAPPDATGAAEGSGTKKPPAAPTPSPVPPDTPTSTPAPTDTPVPTSTPTATATAVPTLTATPKPTATPTPEPVITFVGSLQESVAAGGVDTFTSTVTLVADFESGTASGIVTGNGAGLESFSCVAGDDLLDIGTATYVSSYSGTFLGRFDTESGGFSGELEVGGVVTAFVSDPFTHPACLALNDEPLPAIGAWSGGGSISGSIWETSAVITTSWTAGLATAGGSSTLTP